MKVARKSKDQKFLPQFDLMFGEMSMKMKNESFGQTLESTSTKSGYTA